MTWGCFSPWLYAKEPAKTHVDRQLDTIAAKRDHESPSQVGPSAAISINMRMLKNRRHHPNASAAILSCSAKQVEKWYVCLCLRNNEGKRILL